LNQPEQCLNHLSGTLITRFRLEYDDFQDEAGRNSAFFSQLLAEASRKDEGPLWIVVDAADEAIRERGKNPLLLPSRLPKGVYFLVTHRNQLDYWSIDPETQDCEYHLRASDPAQLADVKTYLCQQAKRPEIQKVLENAAPAIPVENFVQGLSRSSEGNFTYLGFVITDIIRRKSFVSNSLPLGLGGYYASFWSLMAEAVDKEKDWPNWNSLYRPVLELLAVAREPVAADWLADIIGRPAEEISERALDHWERFLRQDELKGQARWRIVHRSFADFLAAEKKVDLRAAQSESRCIIFHAGERSRRGCLP
jgi:hypothetical protein